MTSDDIDLTGLSILIVDDQPLSIKLMEALLNQKGFKTYSATTGQDALAFLEHTVPDLVMLDVMMPGMTGFEVCQRMRVNDKTADVPVIFVTARDDAETISKCFEAGGSDYAAKPLRIFELLARVKLGLTSSIHKKRAEQSEEALEESQQFLLKIIDENPAQIFVINNESRLLMVNKKFADIFETNPEALIGFTISELIEQSASFESLPALLKRSSLGEDKHSFEMRYTNKDDDHWLLCTRLPFTFHHEECVLGINMDFTDLKKAELEKKRLEEQLGQSQKMEVIGTLAGGIAHDFNNMLAVILGYTDLAKNTLPEGAKQINHLNEVTKAGIRAKDLVKQILNFSRQTEIQHVDISMTMIVKEVVKMVKSTLPSKVTCEVSIDQKTSFVKGDQTQVHQVLMNLCVNANQAMAEGGTLTVSLDNYPVDRNCIECSNALPGSFVHLAVTDTGSGMTEAVKKRIFEPYFTTKDVGKGTGMGLAVVHGIVNQHNGHLCVETELGKGSTFHLFLPASQNILHESIQEDSPIIEGKEKILIVDDEPMVGELVLETLSMQGYEGKLFHDSSEALEEFKQNPNKYDLVLSDYMMPNMTGDKLAMEIRKINKTVPIVLATGFSNNITKEVALSLGITEFLMKPIVGNDLCRAVRECLENAREGSI